MHFGQIVEKGFDWIKESLSSAAGTAIFETLKTGWTGFARTQAPHLARDLKAEAVYAARVNELPEDSRAPVLDWLHEMELSVPGISERRLDLMQSISDMDGLGNHALVLETLRYLAELPNHDARTAAAVGLGLMRELESDYAHMWEGMSDQEAQQRRAALAADRAELRQAFEQLTAPSPSAFYPVFTWFRTHGGIMAFILFLALLGVGLSIISIQIYHM